VNAPVSAIRSADGCPLARDWTTSSGTGRLRPATVDPLEPREVSIRELVGIVGDQNDWRLLCGCARAGTTVYGASATTAPVAWARSRDACAQEHTWLRSPAPSLVPFGAGDLRAVFRGLDRPPGSGALRVPYAVRRRPTGASDGTSKPPRTGAPAVWRAVADNPRGCKSRSDELGLIRSDVAVWEAPAPRLGGPALWLQGLHPAKSHAEAICGVYRFGDSARAIGLRLLLLDSAPDGTRTLHDLQRPERTCAARGWRWGGLSGIHRRPGVTAPAQPLGPPQAHCDAHRRPSL